MRREDVSVLSDHQCEQKSAGKLSRGTQTRRAGDFFFFFFFFLLKTSFSFQLWRDGNLPVPDTPRETRAVERYWLFPEAVHGAAGELNPVLGRERDPGRGELCSGAWCWQQRHPEAFLGHFKGVWTPREPGATGDPPPTYPPSHMYASSPKLNPRSLHLGDAEDDKRAEQRRRITMPGGAI